MKKLVLSALSVAVFGMGFATMAEEKAAAPAEGAKQEAAAPAKEEKKAPAKKVVKKKAAKK
uniref:hypothetical protein n=1 Tax=Sulfurihydrogenibium sp. TaxID=2053621 RepID=UPI00262C059E